MNKHIFFDKLTARIGALAAGRKKFFANSIDSPSIQKHIENVDIEIPEISCEETHELTAKTLVGEVNPAFKVVKWYGKEFPTIIYHHGNNEQPFNFGKAAKNTFANIFIRTEEEIKVNLIVVRAPFHNNSLKVYQQKISELRNFIAMLAVSVKINEEIISKLRKASDAPVVTCGISLGGWVTNIHRSYFNTSTAYIPLFAGTLLGELFLRSKYNKLTSELALEQPAQIRQLLNFNVDYQKVVQKNVYPLLAQYDQFIEYNVQKSCYDGYNLETIESGHVTGSLESKRIREHIVRTLEKLTL